MKKSLVWIAIGSFVVLAVAISWNVWTHDRVSDQSEARSKSWSDLEKEAEQILGQMVKEGRLPTETTEALSSRLRLSDVPRSYRATVLKGVAEGFCQLARESQKTALEIAIAAGFADRQAFHSLLVQATRVGLVHEALQLGMRLPEGANDEEILTICRSLIEKGLRSVDARTRADAVALAGRAPFHMYQKILGYLRDADPRVRRQAILALGPQEGVMPTDHLIYWLHDPDADVRRLCEAALRGRGLSEHHLKLGKMITDPKPSVRLQVIDLVREDSELDPHSWLERLSRDPSPAVRAACVRLARERNLLQSRLLEMQKTDPSPTIRQLAGFYLSLSN
ncbi:MAG: hypothetical protein KatS3mg105_1004 [Gemmatales bacterium]|nr:MAG: hypothetical protein KatS3mg105_1004 [Gemmatales bacterium]